MNILLVAGDVSGDFYGAQLIHSLKAQNPHVKIAAVGGQAMAQVADRFWGDLVRLSVGGFWEPLRQIGSLRTIFHQWIQPAVLEADVVIPIDYYGFNIHVCRFARAHHKNIFYFISPQVWATRSYRVKKLAACGVTMLTIFPFEEAFYRERGAQAYFVGHPLLDVIPQMVHQPASAEGAWTVGLLPGSRRDEIRRHWPLLLESAKGILRHWPSVRFKLFQSPHVQEGLDVPWDGSLPITTVKESHYVQRKSLDVAITCSGTATLENALLGIPMVVVYKTSWPTYLVAKMLIQVKAISIVNILAQKRLVPEFIQHQATSQAIVDTLVRWKESPWEMAQIRQELLHLRSLLGDSGATDNASKIILNALTKHDNHQKAAAIS